MPSRLAKHLRLSLLLLAGVTLAQPAFASLPNDSVDLASVELTAGQYRWDASAAADGAVEVVVSIPEQRAYVYRGGTLIGVSTVSTGKPGHDTPVGEFTILQKRVTHFSNRYDNAPMPFMQRLTWDGIALHAGAIPGEPASHGCIRLPKKFAKLLYGVTRLGATVRITDAFVAPSAEPELEPIYETAADDSGGLLQPIATTAQ